MVKLQNYGKLSFQLLQGTKTYDRILHDTPKFQLNPQQHQRTQSAKKKIDNDLVDAHIESFQPSISCNR